MTTVDLGAESLGTIAAAARISSIPTLMASKRGVLVHSQCGALPATSLEQLVTAVREPDEALAASDATPERSA